MTEALQTPVVVLAFNRPELTARLIERLASVRPCRLLVVADGPRAGRPDDSDKIVATRALFDRLPWPCEVQRNFVENNMGCAARVSTGLTWAFQLVEEAIILEDDCLPHPSFFPYVVELLERYRDDLRVGSICGTSPGFATDGTDVSYRLSRYSFIWGWATWRRAWACYDYAMTPLKDGSLDSVLRKALFSRRARLYWRFIFGRTVSGKINTWDYQWMLSCWKHGLLGVLPAFNLVDNTGFSGDSSHTQDDIYRLEPACEMQLPLRHPRRVEVDRLADEKVEDRIFSRNLRHRLIWLHRKFSSRLRVHLK